MARVTVPAAPVASAPADPSATAEVALKDGGVGQDDKVRCGLPRLRPRWRWSWQSTHIRGMGGTHQGRSGALRLAHRTAVTGRGLRHE